MPHDRTSRRCGAIVCILFMLAATHAAASQDLPLIPVKLGLSSMSATDRATLWKRVDDWATADSLLEFCGKKLNIYRRGWNAVTACVETTSLRKVGTIFRAKKASYLKILEGNYPDPEKKKTFCDGLTPQLKDYVRIINAQISEADGMCRACLFC